MSVTVEREVEFLDSVRRIADEVAAPNADSVDREARFPAESIAALRAERALSAFIPTEYGGGGISLEAIAEACFELGRRCGSSAMVFAMHQIKVITITQHAESSEWFAQYLSRVAAEQRLVASVTTELGTGGDLGRSIAAVTPAGDGRCTFEKQAPVVSYGGHADDLFVTLRRSPEAEQNDQVIAIACGDQFDARADRNLGPARHARNLLARLRRPGRHHARADPAHPLPAHHGGVDGPHDPHPVVASVARHRNRRVRSREDLRSRLGQAEPDPG